MTLGLFVHSCVKRPGNVKCLEAEQDDVSMNFV